MLQMFIETYHIAVSSIKANKLRSSLTALGIIIGVMTVIAMTSLIQGMNASVADVIKYMGSNTIQISKFPTRNISGEEYRRILRRKELTEDDAKAIERLCPAVNVAVPKIVAFKRIAYKKSETDFIPIAGITYKYEDMATIDITYGRFFSAADEEHKTRVCILGPDVVEEIFPDRTDFLGEHIYIANKRFTVIGVTQKRGKVFGQSMDNYAIIPFSTFKNNFGKRRNLAIIVQAVNTQMLDKAKEQIVRVLRLRRGLSVDDDNDFEIMTEDTLKEFWSKITRVVFIVMVGIASISLLVGGIGIMNIMLVSVTERTKEIGIRKAIGAKRKDILMQFLVEATILSLMGGAVGILLGISIAFLIGKFTPIPAGTPLWSILIGTSICVIIGIFFGIFPAGKASKLDPIEALRYE